MSVSHEAELANIPDLMRMEFRLMASQIARLTAKVDQLTGKVGELGDLPVKSMRCLASWPNLLLR